MSFCFPVSSLWADAGGIALGPLAEMRAMISLLSGSPGTIGARPDRVGFSASSRISSRMPAMRAFRSGP
jgi:hypothetical protein